VQNQTDDVWCLLLGTTVAGAINVDDVDAQTEMSTTGTNMHMGSTSPTFDASTSAPIHGKLSRRRGPTSKVWLNFEEVTAMPRGKEVRVSAIFLHCKNNMSAKSSSGTSHLIQHPDLCPPKKEKDRSGKTQHLLKYNADGSDNHCEYSPSVASIELCGLIARLDLPFCCGESNAFQEYINERGIGLETTSTLVLVIHDHHNQLS
jgi:hypothetical protein